MKRNKVIAMISALSLTLSLLVGCGGSTETAVETTETTTEEVAVEETVEEVAVSDEVVTLTVLAQQSQNTAGHQAMFEKLEEINIVLDVQVVPDDQFLNLLQMKKASGELPDLVNYNVPNIYGILVPEDDLYDLSDTSWASELLAPDMVTYNDSIYAFPYTSGDGFPIMIYNKTVFDTYGLSIPTTADEFAVVCETLIENGVTPIAIAGEQWVPQIWMSCGYSRALGGTEATQAMCDAVFSGQAVFTDYPEMIATIDEFLSFNEKGYFNTDVATLTADEQLIRVGEGTCAMLQIGNKNIDTLTANYPDSEFGAFLVPMEYDAEGLLPVSAYTNGLVVNKNSENIETILKMFEYLATPEVASLYFEEGVAGFPAFEGVSGGDIHPDVLAIQQEKLAEGKTIAATNDLWTPIESILSDTIWVYYTEALTKGNMDGEEILTKFQEDVNKHMKQNGVEGF